MGGNRLRQDPHHHTLVLDADGNTLLSRQVANDKPELLQLLAVVLEIVGSGPVTWALDMPGGEPGLLIALVNHGQELVYISGLAVNRATDNYRGQGKTDARDARVIADQARMRRDLQPIRPGDEATIELRLVTEHRVDLVADRTRTTNRLKAPLTSMFPALERSLHLDNAGPLILLTGYQTPVATRHAGTSRLTTWLRNRKVRGTEALAAAAVEAANRQDTAVTCEKAIAKVVSTLTREVMALNVKRETLQRAHDYGDAGIYPRTVFAGLTRYNTRRRHSANGHLSPNEYEHHSAQLTLAV